MQMPPTPPHDALELDLHALKKTSSWRMARKSALSSAASSRLSWLRRYPSTANQSANRHDLGSFIVGPRQHLKVLSPAPGAPLVRRRGKTNDALFA
jgi:hypothetical protein